MKVHSVATGIFVAVLAGVVAISYSTLPFRVNTPEQRGRFPLSRLAVADEPREAQILRTVIRGLEHRESLIKSCSAYVTLVWYEPKRKDVNTTSSTNTAPENRQCWLVQQWYWAFEGEKSREDQKIVWPSERRLYLQQAYDGDRYYQYNVLDGRGYVARTSYISPFSCAAGFFIHTWKFGDRPLSEQLGVQGSALWLVGENIMRGDGGSVVIGYRFPLPSRRDFMKYLQLEFAPEFGMYPKHVEWMMCQTAKGRMPGTGRLHSFWAQELNRYGDIWLPKSVIAEQYDLTEGKVGGWRGSYLLQVHDIRVNEPFIGTPFALEFPIGAIVGDEDTGWMAHTVGGEIDVEALAKSTGPPPHWKVGDQPVSVPQQFSWKEIK
jgi:hypothetical protein